MGDLARRASERGEIAAELSRREVLARASTIGLGAVVASALPLASRLALPPAAEAAVFPADAVLQAFSDTVIPGRKASRTDLGDEIHPLAIAGVDREPGAVEADALRLLNDPVLGFPVLAPPFIADLTARALLQGGDFVSLPFEKRVAVVAAGLDFGNPLRVVYEAAAGIPFVAFCAAGTQRNPTSRTHSGLRVMGHPGTAPGGYRDFSYGRKLATERTKKGYL
jgi:hypothetical protein